MAKTSRAMSVTLVLMLSFLIFISMAESRILTEGKTSTPTCLLVVGVASGDTCFSIEQTFQLTDDVFSSINPNLDCDDLFVGQWVCINGAAN